MTPIEAAFIADVIANPDDDTVRLIYADWLEDNGQPERAEFIRVQCKLAILRALGCHEGESCNVTGPCSECHRDVEAEPLRRRESELFDYLKSSLFGAMPLTSFNYAFRRGFMESFACTAADWLTHADAITAQQPIRSVVLTTGLKWLGFRDDGKDVLALAESGSRVRLREWYRCRWAFYRCWEGKEDATIQHILALEWPGITFILPS